MNPKFTTSDFVRPYREDLKGGYVLEAEPVIEDGKTVTFMYTFMNYRSGELCRYAEGDLKKSGEPRDYDHPERVRVKPLAVGDTVFDSEVHLFAVITKIYGPTLYPITKTSVTCSALICELKHRSIPA